jgi:CarD family transcriptional regulator
MAAKALSFDVGDYVVYPKHGVGRVVELQSTDIAGMQLELYVLRFEKEKMTLRVPTNKAESVGMRKLSSDKTLKDALETLKGKPKVKRTMWSRRAQEYEAKINSGDLISIAEVTRDLFRADDQPEQSYSERQIFEAASSRLARELAAMEEVDEPKALEKILEILNKACGDLQQGQGAGLSAAPASNREGRSGNGPPFSHPGGVSLAAIASDPTDVYCMSNTAREGRREAEPGNPALQSGAGRLQHVGRRARER